MKPLARLAAALVLVAAPSFAWAQGSEHHPDSATGGHPAPSTAPAPNPAQQGCGSMMQMMQMMQGGMGDRMSGCMANLPEASRAYMAAMMTMQAPMMEAMQIADPDVTFLKAMVAHHKAAIEMSRAALRFGKDERARSFAQKIIDAQQAEIDSMQEWLRQRGQ